MGIRTEGWSQKAIHVQRIGLLNFRLKEDQRDRRI